MNDENRLPDEDKKLEEQLRRFKGPTPDASVWNAIEQRIEVEPRSVWPRLVFAAAALAIAALTIAFLSLKLREGIERPGDSDVPWMGCGVPHRLY